ncbi:MAG: FAD-dependent oxidoreductase [Clostridia bacterium]|nr:FAD-dependent oxidoreductase [Clostridia bacterium]
MRRPVLPRLGLSLLVLLLLFTSGATTQAAADKLDILIYGGSLAACAAARTAAADAPAAKIGLVIPYPARAYGGLATVGGQNFWDVRLYHGDGVEGRGEKPAFPQGGSFARWYARTGHFYGTHELAALLNHELAGRANLKTYWSADVEVVRREADGRPGQVWLRELVRGPEGFLRWGRWRLPVKARLFIDASEDGRLARLAGVPVTTGRADWPPCYLAPDRDATGRLLPRQQAATLMFKVTGVQPGRYPDMVFLQDEDGTWGAYGGLAAYLTDPVITAFNRRYGPQGYALKPLNAAQNGNRSGQWWVNALLIFEVDGRANFRDRGTTYYPRDLRPEALETDRAWARARRLLKNPEFLAALRRFPGFHRAELVLGGDGYPEVGEILYLRETVHAVRPVRHGVQQKTHPAGKEETAYTVTPRQVYLAGPGPGSGEDRHHYATRIGLGFYWLDINAYRYRDLQAPDGRFRWPVTAALRPDYSESTPGPGARPYHPVYLPYDTLISPQAPNVLLPGAAASIASLAWAELRVLPNLALLGDAAGAAAAHSLECGRDPARFTPADLKILQARLATRHGARLEKTP